ncbi:MAG: hypothetical protein U1E53_03000 [Dongiaceae bacterium]
MPAKPSRAFFAALPLALCLGLALAAADARAEPKYTEKQSAPPAASATAASKPAAPAPAAPAAPAVKPAAPAATPAIPYYQQDAELGRHEIRLLGNGTELEFVGALTVGAVRELAQALARNPAVRVLQLTSQGGVGEPVIALADDLARRRLTTYVPAYCASACTFLFMAGHERYIAANARLGFHQAASMHGTGDDDPKYNAALGTWLVSHGVAPDFVEKAISTPHGGMWQPDAATLLKARVITGIGPPAGIAQPSFGGDAGAAVDVSLLNKPIYQALRRADPQAYEATRKEVLRDIQRTDSGGGGGGDLAFGTSPFGKAFEHAATIASDQSLVDYASALTDQMELINVKSGQLCLLVATGRPYPTMEVRRILPDYLIQKKIMAATAVLETSVASPQPVPSKAQFEEAMHRLMVRLANALPEEWEYLRHPESDPKRGCFMYNEVYKKALEADPAERSVLLRGLVGDIH